MSEHEFTFGDLVVGEVESARTSLASKLLGNWAAKGIVAERQNRKLVEMDTAASEMGMVASEVEQKLAGTGPDRGRGNWDSWKVEEDCQHCQRQMVEQN